MEHVKLTKEHPEVEFKLNADDSYVLIHSLYIKYYKNIENEWSSILSRINVIAELR